MAKKASTTSYKEIISDLRNHRFAPVYILMGDEDYYIDRVVELLEMFVISEEEKDFNLSTFYGADSDVKQVIAKSQQFPVMASRQLVILKEAQTLMNSKKELEKLASYVKHPNHSTVLVVVYKGDSLPATSQLLKSVENNNGIILRSDRLRDNQLSGPVAEYCKEKGIMIDDKGIALLCEYIGNPLSKLFGEIDKLTVAAGNSKRITVDLIEAVIGISKEFNTFELIKAISLRDYATAMKIVTFFIKNPKQNPSVMVIATLFSYFCKLFIVSVLKDKSDYSIMQTLELRSNYALSDYKNGLRNYNASMIDSIIHAIRETDCKSKGIGSTQNEGDLLLELIFKIFTLK